MNTTTGNSRKRPAGFEFEIHLGRLIPPENAKADELPFKPGAKPKRRPALAIAGGQGPVWVRVAGERLEIADVSDGATLGLKVVRRGATAMLALVAIHDDVLVNGIPALRLSLVRPKDSISIVGVCWSSHVTARYRPFVGDPTGIEELLGQECPSCGITIEAEPATQVATCRCSAVYHHETAESHPDTPPSERLACFQKAKSCIRCHEELTTEEHLLWDPATL